MTEPDSAPEPMRLAYVAGPYRAGTEWELVQNIRAAEHLAVDLWRLGFAVFCPHKNSAHFGGVCPDQSFLAGDLEILSRSDILVCTEGWRGSVGARAEVELAEARGIPVAYSAAGAGWWLSAQAAGYMATGCMATGYMGDVGASGGGDPDTV